LNGEEKNGDEEKDREEKNGPEKEDEGKPARSKASEDSRVTEKVARTSGEEASRGA
jgi:hypothetical protein